MEGCIYLICHPTTKEIRYIGQTRKSIRERFFQHLYNAKKGKNSPLYSWIRKLTSENLIPKMEILEEVPLEELDDAEKMWIKLYKLSGYRLLNMSEGGIGVHPHNFKHSEETIEKIKAGHAKRQLNKESLNKEPYSGTIDLKDKVFGILTVLEYAGSNDGALWLCRCECGREKIIRGSSLIHGKTKSCGQHGQSLNFNNKKKYLSWDEYCLKNNIDLE